MLATSVFSLGLLASVTQAAHFWVPRAEGEAVEVKNYTYAGGVTGPLNWGNLEGFADGIQTCATGTRQSPINIDGSIGAGEAVTINYPESRSFIIENIGATLEAHIEDPAEFTMTIGESDQAFTFNNFHFHTPSEHRLEGESFPLEMHIVNSDGTTNNVLTVLFNVGTTPNAFITSVLENEAAVREPGTQNMTGMLDWTPIKNAFAASAPRKTYPGSLTTPPCTENTNFVVATMPLTISNAQYAALKHILKFNARYTQNGLGETNLLQLSQPGV